MITHARRRIAVAMSGGVDSSVAAYLLTQQYTSSSTTVFGLFLQNWSPQDEIGSSSSSYCEASERDRRDAENVCQHIGIPLHTANFVKEYWTGVFEPFINDIVSGFTPNPDILCNREVKFGVMRDFVLSNNKSSPFYADLIATGHYARLSHSEGELLQALDCSNYSVDNVDDDEWLKYAYIFHSNILDTSEISPLLLAALDQRKDQSYFLCGTKGTSLNSVIFPLGGLYKNAELPIQESVRDIARSANLPTASKRESMGICFIGKRSFPEFVRNYLPDYCERPGKFICVDTGQDVGSHHGTYKYTIGQGAKISGASLKWYVVEKDLKNSTIFVCSSTHHPALYVDEFYVDASKFNWIGGSFVDALSLSPLAAWCRVRHQQPLIQCWISLNQDKIIVKSTLPLRAVTPGQTVALYVLRGIVCLGGGPIRSCGESYHARGMVLPDEVHPSGLNDLSTGISSYNKH